MVSFELGKEIEKDVFALSPASEFLRGIEPQNFGFASERGIRGSDVFDSTFGLEFFPSLVTRRKTSFFI